MLDTVSYSGQCDAIAIPADTTKNVQSYMANSYANASQHYQIQLLYHTVLVYNK